MANIKIGKDTEQNRIIVDFPYLNLWLRSNPLKGIGGTQIKKSGSFLIYKRP